MEQEPVYPAPRTVEEKLELDAQALLIATEMWANGNENMANNFFDAYNYGMPWTRRVIAEYELKKERESND